MKDIVGMRLLAFGVALSCVGCAFSGQNDFSVVEESSVSQCDVRYIYLFVAYCENGVLDFSPLVVSSDNTSHLKVVRGSGPRYGIYDDGQFLGEFDNSNLLLYVSGSKKLVVLSNSWVDDLELGRRWRIDVDPGRAVESYEDGMEKIRELGLVQQYLSKKLEEWVGPK